MRRLLIVTFLIIGLFAAALVILWPWRAPWQIGQKSFNPPRFVLGLDLAGGSRLRYLADTSKIPQDRQAEALRGLVEVVRRRVDAFGVSEPVIQRAEVAGKAGIVVELPGLTNPEEAKRLIGRTAELTFWEFSEEGPKQTELAGRHLQSSRVEFDPNTNEPIVSVTFSGEGARLFEEITSRNVGKPVGIRLDESFVSTPIVQEKIAGGRAVITGRFTIPEAKLLAIQLEAGALPVPIDLVEERTIGPTLGAESIRSSLAAGLVGLSLIALFMLLFYRGNGVLVVLALAIYAALTLSLIKLIPITLTLAGIAGLVLSIGMAVDANILIFERIREEIARGLSQREAIEEGFRRAWSSIRDSNIASWISAAILYATATGPVRGFAVTLALGVAVSMFSAIWATRTFARLAVAVRERWAKTT